MYHDLPRDARFWAVLFAIDQDLADKARNQAELLLRTRRVPEKNDTAFGAVPRPQSLSRSGGHLGYHLAARTDATSGTRTFPTLRRRSSHQRAMAGFLVRAVSRDGFWEGTACSPDAGCRDCRAAAIDCRCVPARRRQCARGLATAASIPVTGDDSGSPIDQGLVMIAKNPQKMRVAAPG